MAYWNPFGWSEETRRSIQSVVRPVMQVASMAAPYLAAGGAKAGGAGAGATGGAASAAAGIGDVGPSFETGMNLDTDFGTSYGADALNPNNPAFTDMPTGSLEMSGDFKQQAARNFQQPTEMDRALGASTTVQQQIADGPGLVDPSLMEGPISPEYQEFIDQSQQQKMFDGSLQANTGQVQLDVQYKPGDELNQKGPMANAETFTHKDGKDIVTKTTQPKPTQTTTQQPGDATKTPNNQHPDEVKPPQTEGPGGKEKGFWDDKPFNLKNALEFLQTPEGLKWLNSDKGLAGIGRRLSAASDAGTTMTLTNEELKKMGERVRKKQEEKRRKNNR